MADALFSPEEPKYLKIPKTGALLAGTFAMPSLVVYADAYYQAAERIMESEPLRFGFPTPDYLIYPILFLLHHYLELELKLAISLSHRTAEYDNKEGTTASDASLKIHDLTKLFAILKENLHKLHDNDAVLDDAMEDIINDLNEFGHMGETLRYPHSTAKNPTPLDGLKIDLLTTFAKVTLVKENINSITEYLLCSLDAAS